MTQELAKASENYITNKVIPPDFSSIESTVCSAATAEEKDLRGGFIISRPNRLGRRQNFQPPPPSSQAPRGGHNFQPRGHNNNRNHKGYSHNGRPW